MSYIDTIQHEFLGYFGHRSVYLSLQDALGKRTDFDFGCSKFDVIVGGGSGELPAIIFSDLDFCVSHFLLEWFHLQDSIQGEETVFHRFIEAGINVTEVRDQLSQLADSKVSEKIAFAGWVAQDYCDSVGEYSSHHFNQFYNSKLVSFEIWLAQNIGELAFFSLPQHLKQTSKLREKIRALVTPVFENILVPPSGYRD